MDNKKVTFELVEGNCSDCYFWKYDCGHVITAIGLKCSPEYILKKVKQYVQCTPENTEVGDTVVTTNCNYEPEVAAVGTKQLVLKVNSPRTQEFFMRLMRDCKKEV